MKGVRITSDPTYNVKDSREVRKAAITTYLDTDL